MEENEGQSFFEKIRLRVFGKPRDIHHNSFFHKLSPIPVLAWIGLGADGLSSSSYGPEEASLPWDPHNSYSNCYLWWPYLGRPVLLDGIKSLL
jgi:hypothetical protein